MLEVAEIIEGDRIWPTLTEVGCCGGCTDNDPEDDECELTRPHVCLAAGPLSHEQRVVPATPNSLVFVCN